MIVSFLTISAATLFPLIVGVAPVHADSASVPSHATYEKHQFAESLPTSNEFRHRGSGRCELPNCG